MSDFSKMSDFEIKTSIIETIEIHKIGLDTEVFNTLSCLTQRLNLERCEVREKRELQDLQDFHESEHKKKMFIKNIVSTFTSYIWLLMRMLYVIIRMLSILTYIFMRVIYASSKAILITSSIIINAVINIVRYTQVLLTVKPEQYDDDSDWFYTQLEDYVIDIVLTNTRNDDNIENEVFYDCIDPTPISIDINPVNNKLEVYDVVFYKLENNYAINIQETVTLKITEEPVKRVNNNNANKSRRNQSRKNKLHIKRVRKSMLHRNRVKQ